MTPRILATVATSAAALTVAAAPLAGAVVIDNPISTPSDALSVAPIGSYDTGQFGESAAEIVSYHAASKRALVVNAQSGAIDVLDISDPTAPKHVATVSGGKDTTINSVDVREDGLAVATVEPSDKTAPGEVILFDAAGDGNVIDRVGVGSLPDMVTMTADGAHALVANEGEPAEDYSADPEGSVSIVDLPADLGPAAGVRTADFTAFNAPGALPEGVRVFGQVGASKTVAQNLEPEYIAVAGDKAYITLQENNAIAVVDIATATVEKIFPVGTVDMRTTAMDVSNKDDTVNLANWPVKSLRQPDAIGSYEVDGKTYLVTANEGDSRDWEGYSEEARVGDLGKDGLPPLADDFDFGGAKDSKTGEPITNAKQLQEDHNLGRLNITTAMGLNEDGTAFDELYAFGGRGFSIFDTEGNLVFDSGSQFEEILSTTEGVVFNTNHEETKFDNRSDDKGPEPEGVTIGRVDGRTYAFIGLERTGGVMVYDITDPAAAKFVTYSANRDFSVDPEEGKNADWAKAGDLGPEGLKFIPASASPNGKDLLIVGNEVSGSTTVFEVTGKGLQPSGDLPGAGEPGAGEPGGMGSSLSSLGSSALLSSVAGAAGSSALPAAGVAGSSK